MGAVLVLMLVTIIQYQCTNDKTSSIVGEGLRQNVNFTVTLRSFYKKAKKCHTSVEFQKPVRVKIFYSQKIFLKYFFFLKNIFYTGGDVL